MGGVAYYIAAHHKSYQFKWIFSAVFDEQNLFLVHVDRKSSDDIHSAILSSIASLKGNVIQMPRHSITWGGWSQVSSELRAIKLALQANNDWKYFINLSGQDYPIKSKKYIQQALDQAWPLNFIRVWSFDRIRQLEPDDPHLRKQVSIELWGVNKRLPFSLPSTKLDVNYKGSQWHMLTRPFCEWLVSNPIAHRLRTYFRHSVCPDETYFQAAIMNSPFRDLRTEDSGRLFVFPGPKTLDVTDLPAIFASENLFARKFDAAVDRNVLDRIAGTYGYPVVA